MIKVEFWTSKDKDVCTVIENRITNGMEIEVWIINNIEEISFDSMDFPCDMEFCYDCYFQSNDDKLKSREIYNMLKSLISRTLGINFSVFVTDNMLNEIYRVE